MRTTESGASSDYAEQLQHLQAELAKAEGRLAAARALKNASEAEAELTRKRLEAADLRIEELTAAQLGLQRAYNELRLQSEEAQQVLSQLGELGISVALRLSNAARRYPKAARIIKAPIRSTLAFRRRLKTRSS